jgi:acetyl esterase
LPDQARTGPRNPSPRVAKALVGERDIGSLALDAGIDALPASDEAHADLEARTLLGWMNVAHRTGRRRGRYSVSGARRTMRATAALLGTREAVDRVEDLEIEGPGGPMPIRIYWPRRAPAPASHRAPLPALVWFHGGGFIVGDLETADGTCRALANRSGAAVVSVDYRLAPEHPLLSARDDCLAATRWVHAWAERLGLDADRLAVGGDSAGGCLAAAVALDCARNGPALKLQLLVYPVTDLRRDYHDHRLTNANPLSADVTRWLRAHLPADDRTLADPRLSPALAPSLAGVAPAMVVTAGCDPLCDDGLDYGRRLRADGVRAHGLHYPGQAHGFLTFDLVLHAARDALARIGDALARALGQRPGATASADSACEIGRRWVAEWHFGGLVGQRFLLECWQPFVSAASALWCMPAPPSSLAPQDAQCPIARYRRPVETTG